MKRSMQDDTKQPSLVFMLVALTTLFIGAQAVLFYIHYKVSDLVDAFVNSSLTSALFYPAVYLPIIQFIIIQMVAYGLVVLWIWFISVASADIFKLTTRETYCLGILNWLFVCAAMLMLNTYYFPDSFFANFSVSKSLLMFILIFLAVETSIAFFSMAFFKRRIWCGLSLLFIVSATCLLPIILDWIQSKRSAVITTKQPNIIIIGLDSLRPDFIHYFGNETIATPNLDNFLQTATTFTHAYTPLARTYPAWVSILTGQYPKHHLARNNLLADSIILKQQTVAQRLQQAGYETIYATDEKRFSNITNAYGFDHVVGPAIGVDDFLLGGLSDFPLSNLLVNLPVGQYLFPYNYANRAAAISYKPSAFINELHTALLARSNKPLFLVTHLCLTHWPFTWARAGEPKNAFLLNQYRDSVQAVDAQFGAVLRELNQAGLLENSLMVLLSDHGTTLGLPNDRMITPQHYHGDVKKLKWLSVERLSSAPEKSLDFKHDYVINTSYGQGNDLLSLKQMRVLLAFKYAGKHFPARWQNEAVSLLDVAPTILDFLHLAPLADADGISLANSLFTAKPTRARPLFMETGDSMTEIETDHIYVEQVIKHKIGLYHINKQNGFLYMDAAAEDAIIKNKQLGVLEGDWLLVRYPAHTQMEMLRDKSQPFKQRVIAPYYVLVNVSTGQWTIGWNAHLKDKLAAFFAPEFISQ